MNTPDTVEDAAYRRLGGGDLINWSDISIYIVGEPDKNRGWVIRVVKSGAKDPAKFDVDFFKLQGQWYKVYGPVVVTGKKGKYGVSINARIASTDNAAACEKLLQEYLKKKKSDYFDFEE